MFDDRSDYESKCAGKDKYPSLSAVEATLRAHHQQKISRQDRRFNSECLKLTPYPCEYCGQFHFGH